MPADAVLDPAVLERLRQLTPPDEPDVLSTVLRIFVEEVPKRMAQLREAWAQGDAPGVVACRWSRPTEAWFTTSGAVDPERVYGAWSPSMALATT